MLTPALPKITELQTLPAKQRACFFLSPLMRQKNGLEQILHDRLPMFGAYEDAMMGKESFLYHSTLTHPSSDNLHKSRFRK